MKKGTTLEAEAFNTMSAGYVGALRNAIARQLSLFTQQTGLTVTALRCRSLPHSYEVDLDFETEDKMSDSELDKTPPAPPAEKGPPEAPAEIPAPVDPPEPVTDDPPAETTEGNG